MEYNGKNPLQCNGRAHKRSVSASTNLFLHAADSHQIVRIFLILITSHVVESYMKDPNVIWILSVRSPVISIALSTFITRIFTRSKRQERRSVHIAFKPSANGTDLRH